MPSGVYKRTDKMRVSYSAVQRKRYENSAERKKTSDGVKKYYEEHPEFQKEVHNTPEAKANHSTATEKQWANPEQRARTEAGLVKAANRPEVKAHKLGSNNPNWHGGIENFPYPFEFNEEFKELVRERYNHTCMLCKLTQEQVGRALCVHHIDYDKNNLDPDNFLPLCTSCHTTTNNNRTYWAEVLRNVVEINKSFKGVSV